MWKRFSAGLILSLLSSTALADKIGNLPNQNSLLLQGGTWAAPGQPIGSSGPVEGDFTKIISSTYGLMTGLNVINMVDQLGLKCDNSTDNASVFAALDVILSGHPGYFVFFPPQRLACLTSTYMTLESGTTYYAAPNSVTLKATTTNAAAALLAANIPGSVNTLVYGLTFDGALSSTSSNIANVIQIFDADNTVFDTVTIQNTYGAGIQFSYAGSNHLTTSGIRNSLLKNIGNFWRTSGLRADRRQGIIFTSTGSLITGTGNFAVNNRLFDIGLDSISAAGQANLLVSHNYCFNPSYQFATLTSADYGACVFTQVINNVTITDNTAVGMSGNSFDITGGNPGTWGYGITLAHNNSITPGQAGISINGTVGTIIEGNQLYNSKQWSSGVLLGGITFAGNVTDPVVSDNIIEDNQSTPTMVYGIQYATVPAGAPNVVNAHIGTSNIIRGFTTAAFNGGAGYSVPNNLQMGFGYSGAGIPVPTCNAASAGTMYFVIDAVTSPTYRGAYTAGAGSTKWFVACDGTNLLYN